MAAEKRPLRVLHVHRRVLRADAQVVEELFKRDNVNQFAFRMAILTQQVLRICKARLNPIVAQRNGNVVVVEEAYFGRETIGGGRRDVVVLGR